jgi:Mlc titration factor MtfA (ptsG expression regulator)
MIPLLAGAAVAGATLIGGYFVATARERRHEAIRSLPFPQAWEDILAKNVRHYALLPPILQHELQGHVRIFLAEKTFEGCGGLVVTEEMKVTIAALACLLILNRRTSHYKKLSVILIYPRAYKVQGASSDGVTVSDGAQGRLGESWDQGTVVLSWNDVTRSAHNIKDGQNLVLHEFAHQLDQEDGRGDGVPIFEQESMYTTWAEVLSPEFERLKKRAAKGKRSVMDEYGATNPAEFFAVATETFFEKPSQLKLKHPELYEELAEYYCLDPLSWKEPTPSPT